MELGLPVSRAHTLAVDPARHGWVRGEQSETALDWARARLWSLSTNYETEEFLNSQRLSPHVNWSRRVVERIKRVNTC